MTSEAPKVESREPTWAELFKRRKVPRRSMHKRIGLLVAGEYSLSWAHEIGEGGMLVSSDTPLEDDQKIVITFRIPEVVHGVMLGKVVYKAPKNIPGQAARYGIEFVDLDFEIKRRIRNYVASATDYAGE